MQRWAEIIAAAMVFGTLLFGVMCAPKPKPTPVEVEKTRLDSLDLNCRLSGGRPDTTHKCNYAW